MNRKFFAVLLLLAAGCSFNAGSEEAKISKNPDEDLFAGGLTRYLVFGL